MSAQTKTGTLGPPMPAVGAFLTENIFLSIWNWIIFIF